MIDIEITDENNNYVNFRNIDWSITLCLSVEKEDMAKLGYGIYDLPVENKNNLENNKLLTQDEQKRRSVKILY
jgi:hypothetical protein